MTDIEIVNLALSDCGAGRISAIDEDSPAGRQATAKYVAIRDAVLECREWTFAKRRISLSRDAAAPAFGYTYQYVIPSYVLRVIRVIEGDFRLDDWVREGARILTDEAGPLFAEVLVRVGEGDFSPGMVLALAARLTAAFAIPLTENRQLAKDFMDYYEVLLTDAGAMDGSQGRTQQIRPPPLPGRRQIL